MGTSSKQVMDIKVTKGLASVGNEELRDGERLEPGHA